MISVGLAQALPNYFLQLNIDKAQIKENMSKSDPNNAEIFADDMPPEKPEIKLSFDQYNSEASAVWSKIVIAIDSVPKTRIFEEMQAIREQVQVKLEQDKNPSDEEIAFYNNTMELAVDETLNRYKKVIVDATRLEVHNTAREIEVKISMQTKLLEWLSHVCCWFLTGLKKLFKNISNNFSLEKCFEKARELLEYLSSYFRS